MVRYVFKNKLDHVCTGWLHDACLPSRVKGADTSSMTAATASSHDIQYFFNTTRNSHVVAQAISQLEASFLAADTRRYLSPCLFSLLTSRFSTALGDGLPGRAIRYAPRVKVGDPRAMLMHQHCLLTPLRRFRIRKCMDCGARPATKRGLDLTSHI